MARGRYYHRMPKALQKIVERTSSRELSPRAVTA